MSPAALEARLRREGLRPLDYDDGAGGIKVGNRGSGKILDASRAFARATATAKAAAERDRRLAVLAEATIRRRDRRAYALYAENKSFSEIARETGKSRSAVVRLVARVERNHRQTPQETLGALMSNCEPRTIVLFFWLLEKALESPEEVKALMAKARSFPEVRQILEPDEVSDG